jgi:hypothetical protein
MSKSIESGYPRLDRMASGELAIVIGKCSYDEFPECARFWASKLGAQVLEAVQGPDERLLRVQVGAGQFYFAFDEFSYEISVEPQDSTAGKMISSLKNLLTSV